MRLRPHMLYRPIVVVRAEDYRDLMDAGIEEDEAIRLFAYDMNWGERGWIVKRPEEKAALIIFDKPLRGADARLITYQALRLVGYRIADEKITPHSYHFLASDQTGSGIHLVGRLHAAEGDAGATAWLSLTVGSAKQDMFIAYDMKTLVAKAPGRAKLAERLATKLGKILPSEEEVEEFATRIARITVYVDAVEDYFKARRRGLRPEEADRATRLFRKYADKYGNKLIAFLAASFVLAVELGRPQILRKAIYAAKHPAILEDRGRSLTFVIEIED